MLNQFNNNINIGNKALDGLWLRNKVINHNISNVNTPNYKKRSVNFEDELKDAITNKETSLNRTHEKHLPVTNRKNVNEIQPRVSVDKSYSYRFDDNNVNVDTESANLAKNSIMYNAVINQVTGEFDKVKNVISEGSR